MLKSQTPESCEAEKTELDDGVTRTLLSANAKAKSKAADRSVRATPSVLRFSLDLGFVLAPVEPAHVRQFRLNFSPRRNQLRCD